MGLLPLAPKPRAGRVCYSCEMTQAEAADHWKERAHSEVKAARTLFEKGESDLYGEVLFHCHLALELALKAQYILQKDAAAPFTHDLWELAKTLETKWSEDEREDFEATTEMGILSRYGDKKVVQSQRNKIKC